MTEQAPPTLPDIRADQRRGRDRSHAHDARGAREQERRRQARRPAASLPDQWRLELASVALGLLLVLLIIFIAQNAQTVEVQFLGLEGTTPLAVALLIAAAGGILITALAGSMRILQLRRRVRRDKKTAR